ncbi:uncharacterized protein LOC133810465 [Humulus lupulus]|uniref:uncharacterized protein LOC133810465 n=1 Tax=Humulus lupulus TaxID=3486 RepID=UPI002B40295F|nr:uncharacterized protein LOC133810465 [Humulus lupulus]
MVLNFETVLLYNNTSLSLSLFFQCRFDKVMACLDMYNSDHKGHHHHHHLLHHNYAPVSPRISFSNDFADSQHVIRQELRAASRSEEAPPVSSDFEFSVTNHSMMSGADELFFKGRLLPFKETTTSSSSQRTTTTLRDELLAGDEDDVTLRPSKGTGSTRWKSFLGLKKAHNGSNSKKLQPEAASSSASLVHLNKTSSQDLLNINEGGSTCQDVEIGI